MENSRYKFRVWSKPSNKMYFQLKESPCFGLFEGDRAVSIEDVFFYETQDFEVMQYTGLKDKNGKDIYEGDILRARVDQHDVLTCEVVFESPSFCRKWLNKNTAILRQRKIEPLPWNTHIIYEVIGNIYENSDLL